jgi:hypothetical protein
MVLPLAIVQCTQGANKLGRAGGLRQNGPLTGQGAASKEEKKETSNVAYSMNKTWWSWSDDTIRTLYEDINDVECRGVLYSICI